ncbi:MAG: hypothetical protein HGA53_03070 [Anaerolineaceae bacterium]|nr:hypothetical protein [Anaerolineaceae bacterium]
MLIDFLAPILKPQAYLDPGSGSILIQMLLAAALGGAYLAKVYWKKIKKFFNKNSDVETTVEEVEPETELDQTAPDVDESKEQK